MVEALQVNFFFSFFFNQYVIDVHYQVYVIMIQYLYTLQKDPQDKSNYHVSQ